MDISENELFDLVHEHLYHTYFIRLDDTQLHLILNSLKQNIDGA